MYYFLAIPLVAYVAKLILFWPAGWTNHLRVDIHAPADFAFEYFMEHQGELEKKYYHLKWELSYVFESGSELGGTLSPPHGIMGNGAMHYGKGTTSPQEQTPVKTLPSHILQNTGDKYVNQRAVLRSTPTDFFFLPPR